MVDRLPRPPQKPQKANLQKAVRGKSKLVARLLQQFHEQQKISGALFQSKHGPKNHSPREARKFGEHGRQGGRLV